MRFASMVALLWLAAMPVRREEPAVIPWAWERNEDLRFTGSGATVAWYAGIITLDGAQVRVEPRRNPLRLAENTHRVAVIRIETKRPTLDDEQLRATLDGIRRLHRNAEELQLDFDATRSERAFYRALLVALRNGETPHPPSAPSPLAEGRRLSRGSASRDPSPRARGEGARRADEGSPVTQRLSITALASWCLGDRWLHDLPIDEAVPMLFRMGRDDREVRARLDEPFPEPRCRGSVGISLDEPLPQLPQVARVWVFNPERWTEAEWKTALSRAR